MITETVGLGIYGLSVVLLWGTAWRLRLLKKNRELDERSCTFEFSKESWERLKLEAEDDQRTPVQQIKYALQLLDLCQKQVDEGGKVLLVDETGTQITHLKL
jgi:hypothetical protein